MSRPYNTLHEEDNAGVEVGRPGGDAYPSWLDSSIESPADNNQHASLTSSNDGFQPFSYKVKPPNKRCTN